MVSGSNVVLCGLLFHKYGSTQVDEQVRWAITGSLEDSKNYKNYRDDDSYGVDELQVDAKIFGMPLTRLFTKCNSVVDP